MRILVCLKQVPARDSVLQADQNNRWIELADLAFETNEPDAYALEEALRLKETHSGEVIAVSAGPQQAAATLREALAKGADRGILLEEDSFGGRDPLATARALAAAIREEEPDLILTGLQSDDAGYGQTGVVLAELLGLPHVTLVVEIEVDGQSLRVKRELESGSFERVEIPLPALLTIQSGINKVRYATLMGIKKARSKPLKRIAAADLGVQAESALSIKRVYAPVKSKQTRFIEGSVQEQAQRLVELLSQEARVL